MPFQKSITAFVPGADPLRDRQTLRALRQEGPVLVLADSERDFACGAEPGPWTLVAPRGSAIYEAALKRASRVVSTVSGLSPAVPSEVSQTISAGSTETFAFCCVADSQYLPFFFALVENLAHVHTGPLEIHLLAVDEGVEPAVRAQFPDRRIEIYPLREVWNDAEWERIAHRPRALQALSSKPRIFLKARQRSKAEALFLLDLDMYFFRSPVHLNQAFGEGHTLFFPQWSDRFTWARLHGIFNSGMVGAKKGAEPFIAWWSEACWISCELEVEQGRFGDQAFIDQAIL